MFFQCGTYIQLYNKIHCNSFFEIKCNVSPHKKWKRTGSTCSEIPCTESYGAFLRTALSRLAESIWINSKHSVFTQGTSSSSAWCWWASVQCNPLGVFGDRLGSGNETNTDRLADMFGHTLKKKKKKRHQQNNPGCSVWFESGLLQSLFFWRFLALFWLHQNWEGEFHLLREWEWD